MSRKSSLTFGFPISPGSTWNAPQRRGGNCVPNGGNLCTQYFLGSNKQTSTQANTTSNNLNLGAATAANTSSNVLNPANKSNTSVSNVPKNSGNSSYPYVFEWQPKPKP